MLEDLVTADQWQSPISGVTQVQNKEISKGGKSKENHRINTVCLKTMSLVSESLW